ncbi:hypothetical protein [Methylomonas sp. AM2-LC]|uniref:transglycosylase SLT domain-containing protein n=1 Tax=Methylomonas sp. AM2-LC TaxID=3153301 RepID=UPI0032644D5E
MYNKFLSIVSLTLLSACTTVPPKNTENICQIFRENVDWYTATLNSAQRWGVPIAVQMAIINQESAFKADAQPPIPLILGFIPWFRSSSAYGYPQAKDETWDEYQHNADNNWASREDFSDSCDFVAWYCDATHKKLGIANNDTLNLYLTYHEGITGFKRSSYAQKPWLLNIAKKVQQRAKRYDAQLATCREELDAKK